MAKLALLGGEKVRNTPFPSHPVLGKEEKKEILEVLKTGVLSGFVAKMGDGFLGGPKVKKLEEEFCKYFNVRHAITINSATAGLHIALAATGIGPGDEVIVTPYTMSATSTSILMANAIPVFADIEDETYGLDPKKVEQAISDKTKAIIVVHLFGHPAKMDEIMAIARKHNLIVIEDCAQAPGAIYNGRFVGTIGRIGIFSFNQHKTITTGEGGVAITNDENFARRMRLIRNHAENIVDSLPEEESIVNLIGWNYRMTEIEAAIGIGQFHKLDMLTEHRIGLANYLSDGINKLKSGITPAKVSARCKSVYFVLPMRYDEEKVGIARDTFVKAVVAEGVAVAAGYAKPQHLRRTYREKIGYGSKGCPFSCPFYGKEIRYGKGMLPVAEKLYNHELLITSLCHYPLKKSDMDDIVRAFEKVLENKDDLKDIKAQQGSMVK
ncbi:MAG: DegT/DnrJ/EryC1/StrS family aminotransferase [Candidatus Omnitrophica bacterium]|nr:DegT/DnrJ/EryC1/StrS family aminotransferase [Candidatus Omnitrophota bacterium]MBU4487941.1 DegT/DnrJ/EryC1/StrS family aminotransferase [Candidatus Omnitrophota bacterium]MCG2705703.1 DegT/DnrJ/EryC1/StrS family aminotransferase [Candidatus Omnitrophota bacterium]